MASAASIIVPAHSIAEDPRKGVIRIHVEGFFDLPTLRCHFAENAAVVARWRLSGRPVRVLIDAIGLMPHTPEGQACVQASTARIYRSGDRVAVLVASVLIKMQMRRALEQGDLLDFFTDEREALGWLWRDG
jgi:hypothetical protein